MKKLAALVGLAFVLSAFPQQAVAQCYRCQWFAPFPTGPWKFPIAPITGSPRPIVALGDSLAKRGKDGVIPTCPTSGFPEDENWILDLGTALSYPVSDSTPRAFTRMADLYIPPTFPNLKNMTQFAVDEDAAIVIVSAWAWDFEAFATTIDQEAYGDTERDNDTIAMNTAVCHLHNVLADLLGPGRIPDARVIVEGYYELDECQSSWYSERFPLWRAKMFEIADDFCAHGEYAHMDLEPGCCEEWLCDKRHANARGAGQLFISHMNAIVGPAEPLLCPITLPLPISCPATAPLPPPSCS